MEEKTTECCIALGSISDVKEFTTIANNTLFEMDVVAGRYRVDAKSIMGILSLDLSKKLKLIMHAGKEECRDFLEDVARFVTD